MSLNTTSYAAPSYFADEVGIGISSAPQGGIEILGFEKAIVFDDGQAMITVHDGYGNFNILAGIDHNNNTTASAGGTRLEMSDSGAFSLETYTGAIGTAGVLAGQMYLDSDEVNFNNVNVGIGDTAPSEALSIRSAAPGIKLTNTASGALSYLTANSSVGGVQLLADSAATVANSYISLTVDGTRHLTVLESGEVGIGTVGPSTNLQVSSAKNYTGTTPNTSSFAMSVTSGNPTVSIGSYNNQPAIQGMGTGTSYNLFLNPGNGSVGVGNNAIGTGLKLDVEGKVGATHYCDESGNNCTAAGALGSGYWSKTGDDVWYSPGATGEVGIGISNPTEELVVNRSANNAPTTVAVQNSSTGTGTNTRAGFTASSNGAQMDMMVYSAGATGTIGGVNKADGAFIRTGTTLAPASLNIGTGGAQDVNIFTNDTTRLTVDGSTGNVGVGTNNPDEVLEIAGNINHSGGLFSDNGTYKSQWMRFQGVVNGNSVGIGSGGHTVIGSGESRDQLMNNVAATTEQLSLGSDSNIRFYTALQSGWGSRVEALEIESDGSVGIGTMAPSEELHVFKNQANPTTIVAGNTSTSNNTNTRAGFTAAANGGQLDIYHTSSAATGNVADQTKADTAVIRTASGAPSSKLVLGTGSASPVNFITSDVTRMTISAVGDVGIGADPGGRRFVAYTSDNQHFLAFNDEAPNVGVLRVNAQTAGEFAQISLRNTGNNVGVSMRQGLFGGKNQLQIGNDAGSADFTFDVSDNELGIGTTTPTRSLDVAGSGVRIDHSNANYDLWIQGGSATSGDDRNLAILGLSETAGDYLGINWSGEYAGGTRVISNLAVGANFAPARELHVRKDQAANTMALVSNNSSASGADVRAAYGLLSNGAQVELSLYNTGATGTLSGVNRSDTFYIRSTGGAPVSNMVVGTGSAAPLHLITSDVPRLTIGTGGNVGIGDTTPDATLVLDVEGQIGATEYCDQNGANCTAAAALGGGKWLDGVGANEIHYSAANVGIGTNNPAFRLHTYHATVNAQALFESGDSGASMGVSDSTGSAAVYTSGNGDMRLYVGGDEGTMTTNAILGLIIEDTGDVGIGTSTNPSEELHVRKDQNNAPTTVAVQNASTGTGTDTRAGFTAQADAGIMDMMVYGSNATGSLGAVTKADSAIIRTHSGTPVTRMAIGNGGPAPVHLVTSDLVRMTVDAGGNVGIGASLSPQEKLDVEGSIVAKPVNYASNQDGAYMIAGATNYTGAATNWGTKGFQHRIKSDAGGTPRVTIDAPSGGEVFTVLNGGNIGINRATPSQSLDVNGNGLFRGRLAVNDAGALGNDQTVDIDRTATNGNAQYGILNTMQYNGTQSAARTHYADFNRLYLTGNNNSFSMNGVGVRGEVEVGGTTNTNVIYGIQGVVDQNSSVSLAEARGVYSQVDTAASTTMNTGIGFFSDLSNNGTINNYYGIYINDVVEGTQTNAYALWANEGDFILDGDGNGVRGGTHNGSDLFFGESQDAAIWYDGADLNIDSTKVGTGNTVFAGQIESPELIFQRTNNGVADKTSILGGSGNIQMYADAAVTLYESDANSAEFQFDLNNGRLGVNKTSPSQALDVNGNVRVEGRLMIDETEGLNAIRTIGGDLNCPAGLAVTGFSTSGIICGNVQVYQ